DYSDKRWWVIEAFRKICDRQKVRHQEPPRPASSGLANHGEPSASHSRRYSSNELGEPVPGLSSLPNSKPHRGHTSYDGRPRWSSYGGVSSTSGGGGHSS